MNEIKIFTLKNCGACLLLKQRLDDLKINFIELPLDDDEDNNKLFDKVLEISNEDSVPTVLLGNIVLAPEKSFNHVDELVEIILNFKFDNP